MHFIEHRIIHPINDYTIMLTLLCNCVTQWLAFPVHACMHACWCMHAFSVSFMCLIIHTSHSLCSWFVLINFNSLTTSFSWSVPSQTGLCMHCYNYKLNRHNIIDSFCTISYAKLWPKMSINYEVQHGYLLIACHSQLVLVEPKLTTGKGLQQFLVLRAECTRYQSVLSCQSLTLPVISVPQGVSCNLSTWHCAHAN